jgi:hypothetical protein
MQIDLIRYRTRPEQAAANEELIRAVYEELRKTQPDGLSYATFRLADQVTFLHLVGTEQAPSPLLAVRAFSEFQAGIADRCDQLPVREQLTTIGSYRLFG